MADFADRSLGSAMREERQYLCATDAALGAWYRSAGSVFDRYRQFAEDRDVLLSRHPVLANPGTALGDWMADTRLGYEGRALVFGAGLAVVAAAYFFSNVSRTLLFWSAFILTRPLGATRR